MSKKDYVAIARLLASYVPGDYDDLGPSHDWLEGHEACRIALARDLASIFEEDNPLFDRERFLAAAHDPVYR